MLDLNDLQFFALIVDNGGFTATERATGVHRSKLSRRIAQLEEQLGVRLMQRTTRRLALTEAGEAFYAHCAAMRIEAEAAETAVQLLRTEPAGTVRISCPVAIAQLYVAQLIAEFMVEYPRVRVELDSTDRTVNLIEERVDIAIRARGLALEEPGLVARQVSTGSFILVASPQYMINRTAISSPLDAAQLDTVGQLREGEVQTWRLQTADGRSEHVVHRPRLLCSDLSVQYEAAISGVGIALLPQRMASRGIKYGALVHLAEGWSTPEEGIHLMFVTRRGMLPSVRALVDHLTAQLPVALQG